MDSLVRRSFVASLAAALTGIALAGCGGSPTAPGSTSSHIGRYNLVSAKGQTLPAVVYESGGSKQLVTGGYVELRSGGQCAWATDYQYVDGDRTYNSPSSGTGTFTLAGNAVSMALDGAQLAGTLSGNTLTVRADVELVYRKQ